MDTFNSFIQQIGTVVPIGASIIFALGALFSWLGTKTKDDTGPNGKKEKHHSKSFLSVLFFILFCLSLATGVYQRQLVQVVDVTGRSYAEACNTLKNMYLNVDESSAPLNPTDEVISQSPTKGTYVLKWTPIHLVTKEHLDPSDKSNDSYKDELTNLSYLNNGGFVCKQDDNYFLATDSAIYITNQQFSDFDIVTYEDSPMNLIIAGEYIYYSTENGIYRIKSDGSEKSLIFYTGCRTLKMQIANSCLYYLKATDSKLYYGPNSGGKSEIFYDSEISNFCVAGLRIYVCDAKIEKRFPNHYPMRTASRSITYVSFNREFETTIYPYSNNPIAVVDGNLCTQNEILYFSTMEGIYAYPIQGTYQKVINIDATDSLCVQNEYIYCSPRDTEVKCITQYQISDGKLIDTYYIPLNFNTMFRFIFPTEEKIILSTDLVTWYSLDKNTKEFSTLPL